MAQALEDQVIEQLERRPVEADMLFQPTHRRVRVLFGGGPLPTRAP